MIRFHQDELDGLVESLRDQPGFITAAVVPAGSGDALLERLRQELTGFAIEVADAATTPVDLGARAVELGRSAEDHVVVLRLDAPDLFASEDEAVRFWSQLNYQRESLGSVRTCLFLNEDSERGLALVADDLWDWTTIFRFPEAVAVSVRTPEDSEALVWAEDEGARPGESDLDLLRSQYRRARSAGLPGADLVENFAVPLFAALVPSRAEEALRIRRRDLSAEAVARLPPATMLLGGPQDDGPGADRGGRGPSPRAGSGRPRSRRRGSRASEAQGRGAAGSPNH